MDDVINIIDLKWVDLLTFWLPGFTLKSTEERCPRYKYIWNGSMPKNSEFVEGGFDNCLTKKEKTGTLWRAHWPLSDCWHSKAPWGVH